MEAMMALSYGLSQQYPDNAPYSPLTFGSAISGYGSLPVAGGSSMSSSSIPVPSVQSTAVSAPAVSMPSVSTGVSTTGAGTGAESTGLWESLGKTFKNEDGSFNMDSLGQLTKTIGAFGQLYAAFSANKLGKESLAFQKDAYNTNLTNQLASYNTALSDRAYNRAAQHGDSAASAQSYIDANRLTR